MIDPSDPNSHNTKSISDEVLRLCGHGNVVNTTSLLSYKTSMAGMLMALAVVYVYWRGLV